MLHWSFLLLWQTFQKELDKYQKEVDTANASGEHLISDILDDPAVTKQDLEELNEAWETTRQLSLKKQERINEALKDAKKFEGGLNDLVMWIDAQSAKLQSQLPPDEDASVLQQQIEEHKVREHFIRLTFLHAISQIQPSTVCMLRKIILVQAKHWAVKIDSATV